VGEDIELAKEWAARRPRNAPEPSGLHLEFILASEVAENERLGQDKQRLAERERLQREVGTSRRAASRGTAAALVAASLGLLVAAGIGILAVSKQQEAEMQQKEAKALREQLAADRELVAELQQLLAEMQRTASETKNQK
jgi:uncharacterized protein HemX